MSDVLNEMFSELRRTRPPVYDGDAMASWRSAMGQVIAAYGTDRQRFACCALVANDLACAWPGASLPLCFQFVVEAVQQQEAMK